MDQSQLNHLKKAAREGDYEELEHLLQTVKFDRHSLDQALQEAVHKCQSTSEHLTCIQELLNQNANPNYKNELGISALMEAARLGQIELVEMLLSARANIKDKDKHKKTVLMYAVNGFGDNEDVVRLLITAGVPVNEQDKHGNSALHIAVQQGREGSVRALLENDALPDIQNAEKNTPMHVAVQYNQISTISLLKQFKASFKIKNANKASAFDLANEHIQKLFLYEEQLAEEESLFSSPSAQDERIICTSCSATIESGICSLCAADATQRQEELLNQIEIYKEKIESLSGDLEISLLKVQACETQITGLLREKETYIKIVNEKDKLLIDLESKLKESTSKTDKIVKKHKKFRNRMLESCSMEKQDARLKVSYLKIPNLINAGYHARNALERNIQEFMEELKNWQDKANPKHQEIIKHIDETVKSVFSSAKLELYGSNACNLHLPLSDLDIVITGVEGDRIAILQELNKKLEDLPFVTLIDPIYHASIPILKMKVDFNGLKVTVDLSTSDSNHRGVRCRNFVRRILELHPIVKPTFMMLKQLFYLCNFTEPYKGGINSYGIFLLTLSYVQNNTRDIAEIENSPTLHADLLNNIITHYVYFNYASPILTWNPDLGKKPLIFNAWHKQEVLNTPDPLTVLEDSGSHNVTHNTNLQSFLFYINNSYYSLQQVLLCDFPAYNKPLLRFFCETKERAAFC